MPIKRAEKTPMPMREAQARALDEFEIVGIYDAGRKGADTSGFYFRYDYFDEARQQGKGSIGWYGVRVDSPDHAAATGLVVHHHGLADSGRQMRTDGPRQNVCASAGRKG